MTYNNSLPSKYRMEVSLQSTVQWQRSYAVTLRNDAAVFGDFEGLILHNEWLLVTSPAPVQNL